MDETTRELLLELQRLLDERDLAAVALTAAMGALFGGLAAAIAALGGGLWIERRREKRARQREERATADKQRERRLTQASAGKHVLLELMEFARPVASLREEGSWPGPVRFSREAWLESRQTLAESLGLEQLLAIDRAYSESEVLINGLNDGPPEVFEMMVSGKLSSLDTATSELDGAMTTLQETIAALEPSGQRT